VLLCFCMRGVEDAQQEQRMVLDDDDDIADVVASIQVGSDRDAVGWGMQCWCCSCGLVCVHAHWLWPLQQCGRGIKERM
jgi:hypothetical protein